MTNSDARIDCLLAPDKGLGPTAMKNCLESQLAIGPHLPMTFATLG